MSHLAVAAGAAGRPQVKRPLHAEASKEQQQQRQLLQHQQQQSHKRKSKEGDQRRQSSEVDGRRRELELAAAKSAKALAKARNRSRVESGDPALTDTELAAVENIELARLLSEINLEHVDQLSRDDGGPSIELSPTAGRASSTQPRKKVPSRAATPADGCERRTSNASTSLDRLPVPAQAGASGIATIPENSAVNAGRNDEGASDGAAGVGGGGGFTLPMESVTGYATPRFLIHPMHPLKVKFDILVALLIIFSVLAVPFRLGFRVVDTASLQILDACIDSLFGIDILLAFRTAYFDEELVGFETNPWRIAGRYLRAPIGFFVDFASTVPVDTIVGIVRGMLGADSSEDSGLLFVKLFRSVRLVRLAKLSDKAKGSPENDPGAFPSVAAMGKMFAILFLIAHIMGCIWYLILDEGAEVSWLNRFFGKPRAADDLSVWQKYVISLYWAMTTMTTVGFGDLVGTSRIEYIVAIIGMLVGASVFGYVIGNVTAVMEGADPAGAQYREKMGEVKSFTTERELPTALARRVRAHFEYVYRKTTVFDGIAAELAETLPVAQACTALYAQHRPVIDAVRFLRSSPPVLVKDLVRHLSPFVAVAGDRITRPHDLGTCLYVLQSGHLARSVAVVRAGLEASGGGGQPLAAHFTSTDLGFEVALVAGAWPGAAPRVAVTSVLAGSPADNAGVRPGHWVACVGAAPVAKLLARSALEGALGADDDVEAGGGGGAAKIAGAAGTAAPPPQLESLEAFASAVRRQQNGSGGGCDVAFHTGEVSAPLLDLEGDAVFGEAAALLHTTQLASTVALARSELWFVPKADLDSILFAWPHVRASLVRRGVAFLEEILAAYRSHGHATRATRAEDLAPHANASDLSAAEDRAVVAQRDHDAADEVHRGLVCRGSGMDYEGLGADQMMATMVGAVLKHGGGSDGNGDDGASGGGSGLGGRKTKNPAFKKPRLSGGRLGSSGGSRGSTPSNSAASSTSSGPNSDDGKPGSDGKDGLDGETKDGDHALALVKPSSRSSSAARRRRGDETPRSAADGDEPGDGQGDETPPSELFAATGLFHPGAPGKLAWDIGLCLVILYSVVTITYQIGFNREFTGFMGMLNVLVDVTFALDIFVTFNTAEVDATSGALITRRSDIAVRYLHGWFAIDFVSTVPFEYIAVWFVNSNTSVLRSVKLVRTVRLVRLAKIARIIRKTGFFDRVEERLGLHSAVFKLANILLVMAFFAHLFACVFFYLAECKEGSDCWIENYCVGGSDWFDDDASTGPGRCTASMDPGSQYLVTVYWSVTTMTTIGYGDVTVTPTATNEMAMMLIIEVIATTLFAYIVGTLVTIILSLDPASKLRDSNLQFLNEYLADVRCSFAFRRSLRLNLLQRQKMRSVFHEEHLMALMPPALRCAVAVSLHGRRWNRQAPLLYGLEVGHRGAIGVLLGLLKPYCFSYGDAVLHPLLGGHRELIFVTSGTLAAHPFDHAAPTAAEGAAAALAASPRRHKSTAALNEAGSPPLERYGQGRVLGEVPFVLPDHCRFRLRLEVRCGPGLSTCLGLGRQAFMSLDAGHPELAAALLRSLGRGVDVGGGSGGWAEDAGAFDAAFGKWVEVMVPRNFKSRPVWDDLRRRVMR